MVKRKISLITFFATPRMFGVRGIAVCVKGLGCNTVYLKAFISILHQYGYPKVTLS